MLLDTGTPAAVVPMERRPWDTYRRFAVVDKANGRHLGVIRCNPRRSLVRGLSVPETWQVDTAGDYVPLDRGAAYDTEQQAVAALLAARDAQQPDEVGDDGLTKVDRDILDFEAKFPYASPSAKLGDIRVLFDLTPTRYYQRLNTLLDSQAALAYQPTTVNMLRNRRARLSAKPGMRIA